MCGLCLPHCPTYTVRQHEGESPRGRISLVKAFLEDQLDPSPALNTHLQSCTTCLKCQQVCPAKVDFESIIDAGRSAYRKHLPAIPRLLQTLLIHGLSNRIGQTLIKTSLPLARRLNRSGYSAFSQLARLAASIPKAKKIAPINTSVPPSDRSVLLFQGCSGRIMDQRTLDSAQLLIRAIGYKPRLSVASDCCSALAQHAGLPDYAKQQQQQLRQHWATLPCRDVVSIASGCGNQLDQLDRAGLKHWDIQQWLLAQDEFNTLKPRALNKKVLLHIPCSLHANPAAVAAMYQLLAKIPQLDLHEFNDNLHCCGAGGVQLLTPETSNQALAQRKAQTIAAAEADLVLSANVGCSSQLRMAFSAQDQQVEIMHPIELLARQLS